MALVKEGNRNLEAVMPEEVDLNEGYLEERINLKECHVNLEE